MTLPKKLKDYTGHPLINGSNWDKLPPHKNDIVICTALKSGTTWMQTIVANLLYQDGNIPKPITHLSPWLDANFGPIDEKLQKLEEQRSRRFFKSHLPLDATRYFDTTKYIYVGRDGRDVFMSLWNHHMKYKDIHKAKLEENAQALGVNFPFNFDNAHDFWANWISKSWFKDEPNGYPYWSNLHHVKSWWDFKDLPNIHFVHFNDLLKNPEQEVRQVAKFLGIEIKENLFPPLLNRLTFQYMKSNFSSIMPDAGKWWEEGGNTFMHKGTNGRWREILTPEELSQYDNAVKKHLPPECAKWLEFGKTD